MLILTRRRSESIEIGENIKITVLAVHGNQVRIGIDAPPATTIHRGEVAERIAAEKVAAANPPLKVGGLS